MTIDWFTFVAQILNFLILLWLLKRFLYRPILDAMDQREARIAARLSEAAEAHEAAAGRERQYHDQLNELSRTREQLLTDAGQDADRLRHARMQESQEEVQTARTQWYQSLAREKQTLLHELQLDVAQHATAVSQHLLQDLADEQLQQRLIERFLLLLADTESETRDLITAAHQNQTLIIETSHKLSDEDRRRLVHEIAGMTSATGDIEFRTNPDLVCGIELHAPDCKLAWSIRDALKEVESGLMDSLEEAIPREATEA